MGITLTDGSDVLQGRSAPATILIVDDRPANLIALEALLLPLGHKIVRADSGRRALELAQQLDDLAVILLDVQMPIMDGFETTRRLRENEHTSAVPVILLTAIYDGHDYATRGYALGVIDYLTKPIQPDVLVAKVGAFVAWYQQREELKRKEAALKAAEVAAQAKDEFLAVVSHELRTPLAAIRGWAELVERRAPDEPTKRAMQAILRSTRAQGQLVEDLLDVSRMVVGKLELSMAQIDLCEVVRAAADTIAPLAVEKGITLATTVPPVGAPMEGSAERLQQIVWNLVGNAVKFSPTGSHVDVALASTEERHVLVVRDSGIGIDRDFLPYVFERFRQAELATPRRGGLGLGLAIARHLVEAHHGTIVAHSDGRGCGSTFTVTLPRRMALSTAA
jgi:signal transduction histidine kinase